MELLTEKYTIPETALALVMSNMQFLIVNLILYMVLELILKNCIVMKQNFSLPNLKKLDMVRTVGIFIEILLLYLKKKQNLG